MSDQQPQPDTLWTADDVAVRCGVDRDRVYEWVNHGITRPDGVNVKLVGCRLGSTKRATWRFTPQDVQNFLNATRTEQAAPPRKTVRLPLPERRFIRRTAPSVVLGR